MKHVCTCGNEHDSIPIVPTGTTHRGVSQGGVCTDYDCWCHAELNNRLGAAALAKVDAAYSPTMFKPVCVHGYTRCMPCKFPPIVIESDGLPYPLTSD